MIVDLLVVGVCLVRDARTCGEDAVVRAIVGGVVVVTVVVVSAAAASLYLPTLRSASPFPSRRRLHPRYMLVEWRYRQAVEYLLLVSPSPALASYITTQ